MIAGSRRPSTPLDGLVIELAEEAYDGPDGSALVAFMHQEIVERYASETAHWSEAELEADTAAHLAEVTSEQTTRPRGAFLVARIDGEPVGCGALKPFGESARTGEIKRMYTAPSARRLGVSRAILQRLEEVAAELGYERIQLETGTEQPEALALYESQGWERIEPYGRYKAEPSSRCYAKLSASS